MLSSADMMEILPVGWSLAEGPVWPVAAVVIDILVEDAMEVPSADEEDAVGALAPVGLEYMIVAVTSFFW
jgi:hypothetical protein